MISLVLIVPVVLGIAVLAARKRIVSRAALVGSALAYLAAAVLEWLGVVWSWLPGWLLEYFRFDGIM